MRQKKWNGEIRTRIGRETITVCRRTYSATVHTNCGVIRLEVGLKKKKKNNQPSDWPRCLAGPGTKAGTDDLDVSLPKHTVRREEDFVQV